MAATWSVLKCYKRMRFMTRLRCDRMLSTERKVRVRFAPSPTGMLHLGGLRTALFNFLFARLNSGKFLLRIEDTDQERKVPGAIQNLEDILQWAGIVQDEGPSAGGPYGPYIQSERIDLYREQVNILLQNGHCYKCFCTEKRLRLMRREASKQGENVGYDNKCRHLTDEEANTKLANNEPYVIRFKYEPIEEPWRDAVFGMMLMKRIGQRLEGDFIVMKSDGFPTYHFANVVDDHFMEVSHVFRGEEWSISTPKHLQMYTAFGWTSPQYAHLPLILAKGGVKLSKRHGDVSVEGYKDKGYEPDAVLNYLTTISGGFRDDTAGKTLEEMVQLFAPDKILTHSSQLQPEKLEVNNKLHLLRRLKGPHKAALLNEARSILLDYYKNRLEKDGIALSDEFLERFIQIFVSDSRITRLNEITDRSLEYIWITPSSFDTENILTRCSDCITLVSSVIGALRNIEEFEEDNIKRVLLSACKENGMKTKDFMYIMRKILSGLKEGPAVSEMMFILTKEETIQRLKRFTDVL